MGQLRYLFNGKRTDRRRRLRRPLLSKLSVESLESRQLLAADGFVEPLVDSQAAAVEVKATPAAASSLSVTADSLFSYVSLDIPAESQQQFSVTFQHGGTQWTLELEKHSVFGENTRFPSGRWARRFDRGGTGPRSILPGNGSGEVGLHR